MTERKRAEWIGNIVDWCMALSILPGLPGALCYWIWVGDWRPTATLAVLNIPLFFVSIAAADALEKLPKENP